MAMNVNVDDVKIREPRIAEWLSAPMRKNKGLYLKVGLATAMINIFTLIVSMFSMTVYDRVIPNNAMSSLVALSIGISIVFIFDFFLKILRGYFIDVAGAEIDQEIGESLFACLLAIRLDQKRGSTGGLTNTVRELETVRDFFASATLTALVDVPFILVTLFVVWLVGGSIVIVPLVLIPIVLIAGWVSQPVLDRLSGQMMSQAMLKQAVLVESVGALEMVKAANAAPLLKKRWAASVETHADISLSQRLISNINTTIAAVGQQIAYAGTVIMGAIMITENELTMGGLIACSMLGGRAIAPLSQIANLLSRLVAVKTSYRQLNALVQTPSEMQNGGLRPSALAGGIAFRNVGFAYPGADQASLSDVSFSIQPGEKVALLGRVGSGKSTVSRIIAGLYSPQEGQVLIDGTEIRQLDMDSYRDKLGYCLQDTVLLSGTVRDNIRLGHDAIDDDEMLRVAQISGTHDFMGRLANGYDLILSDRGESLSGGQRQSIAIARALAGRPKIVLLDEPSSAMDNQTEQGLIQRLENELKDRTVILVTHRLPLLKMVTRVILMDQGKIVADGPRDEILKKLMGKALAA
jgi:ATP-binding cassette, subfamily C, bacterial LapB